MKTLIHLFEDCVKKYADNVYMLEKKNNKYNGITYRDTQEKVYQFSAGLIGIGVRKATVLPFFRKDVTIG